MSDGSHFRRQARKPLSLRVHWKRDDAGSVLEQEGRVTDLGLGGAFVESARPPAVGTRVLLRLVAPTAWDPLSLGARVVRVHEPRAGRPAGFGLEFDPLAPHDAAALYELLHALGYAERPA